MQKIDRDLQKNILMMLSEDYPSQQEDFAFRTLLEIDYETKKTQNFYFDDIYLANMFYLREHGLISFKEEETNDGEPWLENLSITAKGIDFITDDGGLSSILGVVTIKLHTDTVRALLAAKIDASDLSAEEKQLYKSSLSTIKDSALTKLTELAIESAPWAAVFGILKSALSI